MLQVYTGDGKGKTTAAIGLAIRSIGAGMKVYFAQFMKNLAYSEQKILQSMAPNIVLKTSGKPYFIALEGTISEDKIKELGDKVVVFPKGKPPVDYVNMIAQGIEGAAKAAASGKYNLVVLDEINVTLFYELATKEQVLNLLNKIPNSVEVVCTGRCAPQWLMDKADLVTEMKSIKHYYDKGVQARTGIED